MAREWKAKDIGLLLLGTGALIVAIVVAHWYFFEVLPRMHAETGVHAWCSVEGGKAIVQINADEHVENVEVNIAGKMCHYDEMFEGTQQVCAAEANETTMYHISYEKDGKMIEESGICRLFEKTPL
jgi:succinyl-CoA synthetase beta subunit